jgi:hypothetical protein
VRMISLSSHCPAAVIRPGQFLSNMPNSPRWPKIVQFLVFISQFGFLRLLGYREKCNDLTRLFMPQHHKAGYW